MNRPLSYPVPWDLVAGLAPHVWNRTRRSVDDFSARVVARIRPMPAVCGVSRLPQDPRFVLAANHYQRKGLWILHSAAILTQIVRERYGEGDPPVRWIVTASFPPIRFRGVRVPSPGDWLLPRVAHALHCWPVAFHRADPTFTAASLRRLFRESRLLDRPIGLFPEGIAGAAACPAPALPGIDRLLRHLDRPVVPVGVGERGRFVIRIGNPIHPSELLAAPDAGALVMARIRSLVTQPA